MNLGERGGGELGGIERGETVVGMDCMRKESIFNQNSNNKRRQVSLCSLDWI